MNNNKLAIVFLAFCLISSALADTQTFSYTNATSGNVRKSGLASYIAGNGTRNITASTNIVLGSAWRAVETFDTGSVPDDAIITKVELGIMLGSTYQAGNSSPISFYMSRNCIGPTLDGSKADYDCGNLVLMLVNTSRDLRNNTYYDLSKNGTNPSLYLNLTGMTNIAIRVNESQQSGGSNFNDTDNFGTLRVTYDLPGVNVSLLSVPNFYQAVNSTPVTFSCNATSNGLLTKIDLLTNINSSWGVYDTTTVSSTNWTANFTETNIPAGQYLWGCNATTISTSTQTENWTITELPLSTTTPAGAWLKPTPIGLTPTLSAIADYTGMNLLKNYSATLYVNRSGTVTINQTSQGNISFSLSFENNNLTNDNKYPKPLTTTFHNFGATYTAGKVGYGIIFNSSGSGTAMLNYSITGLTNKSGSISFWVNNNNTNNDGSYDSDILNLGKLASTSLKIHYVELGTPTWEYQLGTQIYDYDNIPRKGFFYSTITWNSTNVSIYLNGTLRKVLSNTIPNNMTEFWLGDLTPIGSKAIIIDELSIVDYTKSQELIAWEWANPQKAYAVDAGFNLTAFNTCDKVLTQVTTYDNNSLSPTVQNSSWYVTNDCEPCQSQSGNWLVNKNIDCIDKNITVAGNITVQAPYTLSLTRSWISMSLASQWINIQNQATMTMTDSKVGT